MKGETKKQTYETEKRKKKGKEREEKRDGTKRKKKWSLDYYRIVSVFSFQDKTSLYVYPAALAIRQKTRWFKR